MAQLNVAILNGVIMHTKLAELSVVFVGPFQYCQGFEWVHLDSLTLPILLKDPAHVRMGIFHVKLNDILTLRLQCKACIKSL